MHKMHLSKPKGIKSNPNGYLYFEIERQITLPKPWQKLNLLPIKCCSRNAIVQPGLCVADTKVHRDAFTE